MSILKRNNKIVTRGGLIMSPYEVTGPNFPTSNLVGYYRFDEGSGSTAENQTGDGDLTLNNTSIWTTSGKNNDGLLFPQSSSDYSLTTSNNLGMSDYPISFSWWAKKGPSYVAEFIDIMLFAAMNTHYNGAFIGHNGSEFAIATGDGINSGSGNRKSNLYLASYQTSWTNYVAIVSGWDDSKFFINGSEISQSRSTGTSTSATILNAPRFVIHKEQASGLTRNANVYKDEVAIWNKALTQSEIDQIYNNGNGTFY